MKGMIIVTKDKLNVDNWLTYYDEYGNIDSIDFIPKEDINPLAFENFISKVISSNLDFLSCDIKNFSIDELIKSLENSSKELYAGAISNNMKNKFKKASIKFFDVLNEY